MNEEDMTERCDHCRFARQVAMHDHYALECRVNGPRGVKMDGWSYRDKAVWPTVADNDWCGQFQRTNHLTR